jgi:hypothetical protein
VGPNFENELIDSLKRISDDDAACLISEQAFEELKQAVIAIPPAPARRRRGRRIRRRGAARRPEFALAAAAALAVIVLAASGVFSGDGPVAVRPADAAVLRGALRTLAPPGTIVIEAWRGITRVNPNSASTITGKTRFSVRAIIDIPAGKGAQNELDLSGIVDIDLSGVQSGEVNGNNELYDPKNDTIYITSLFGPDITKGSRPGTDTYTLPKYPFRPGVSAPSPLTITAAQANALRDGTDDVLGPLPDRGRPTATHLKIIALVRAPVQTAEIRAQLKAGKFKVSGMTKTDGRQAIKLIGVHGNPIAEYDVAARSYAPIREVIRAPDEVRIIAYSEYRVLPATSVNARLLNLTLRHPSARVDRSHADYDAAQKRLLNGS